MSILFAILPDFKSTSSPNSIRLYISFIVFSFNDVTLRLCKFSASKKSNFILLSNILSPSVPAMLPAILFVQLLYLTGALSTKVSIYSPAFCINIFGLSKYSLPISLMYALVCISKSALYLPSCNVACLLAKKSNFSVATSAIVVIGLPPYAGTTPILLATEEAVVIVVLSPLVNAIIDHSHMLCHSLLQKVLIFFLALYNIYN